MNETAKEATTINQGRQPCSDLTASPNKSAVSGLTSEHNFHLKYWRPSQTRVRSPSMMRRQRPDTNTRWKGSRATQTPTHIGAEDFPVTLTCTAVPALRCVGHCPCPDFEWYSLHYNGPSYFVFLFYLRKGKKKLLSHFYNIDKGHTECGSGVI